jgi:hypothetical protein
MVLLVGVINFLSHNLHQARTLGKQRSASFVGDLG